MLAYTKRRAKAKISSTIHGMSSTGQCSSTSVQMTPSKVPRRQPRKRLVAGVILSDMPDTPIGGEALDPRAVRELELPPGIWLSLAGTIVEQGLRAGLFDQLPDLRHVTQQAAAGESLLGRHAEPLLAFNMHLAVECHQCPVTRARSLATVCERWLVRARSTIVVQPCIAHDELPPLFGSDVLPRTLSGKASSRLTASCQEPAEPRQAQSIDDATAGRKLSSLTRLMPFGTTS